MLQDINLKIETDNPQVQSYEDFKAWENYLVSYSTKIDICTHGGLGSTDIQKKMPGSDTHIFD